MNEQKAKNTMTDDDLANIIVMDKFNKFLEEYPKKSETELAEDKADFEKITGHNAKGIMFALYAAFVSGMKDGIELMENLERSKQNE